jgi:hypothetical protein
MEFVPIEVVPETIEYSTPGAPWLVGGPYRLYETPQPGQVNRPTYYADWLQIAGHPELNGQFFNIYSEVRDVTSCNEWCPFNDTSASIVRATSIARRSLQSLVMTTIFTHEAYITQTSASAWLTTLQGITNNLAPFNPRYVTLDFASQYVRATRTSSLVSCRFDPASGQVVASWNGKTDLDIEAQIFLGPDTAISNITVKIPAFSAATNVIAATLPVAPSFLNQPVNQTNNAGSTALFSAVVAGSAPLSYQWLRNGTNILVDAGQISGASSTSLAISNVLGGDAAAFNLVVSNSLGSVTSVPVATLTVIDPVITVQPVSRTNHQGSSAEFHISDFGSAPSYQWLKDQLPIGQETNNSLRLPSVSFTHAAVYSVTVSNIYGIRTSTPARLTVVSPLTIQSLTITNGSAGITWNAIPGHTYTVQQSTGSTMFNWSNVLPSVTADAETASATNIATGATQSFYRVFLGQ